MKHYWLSTYSQDGITANTVLDVRPEVWLLTAVRRWPEAKTILLFAAEISESMFTDLKKEI